MGLEETDTEYSNFSIIPANQRKKRGEDVSYDDFFFIMSSVDNNYFMNIAD